MIKLNAKYIDRHTVENWERLAYGKTVTIPTRIFETQLPKTGAKEIEQEDGSILIEEDQWETVEMVEYYSENLFYGGGKDANAASTPVKTFLEGRVLLTDFLKTLDSHLYIDQQIKKNNP